MPIKSIEEQIAGWCKHYASPATHLTCRMGVNYRQLADGDRPGYLNRLPCIRNHFKEDVVAECSLREWPTPEEVAERARATRRSGVDFMIARAAIISHLETNNLPQKNVEGQIPCPICDSGSLRFAIAYNGHCHATCTTEGCVKFLE